MSTLCRPGVDLTSTCPRPSSGLTRPIPFPVPSWPRPWLHLDQPCGAHVVLGCPPHSGQFLPRCRPGVQATPSGFGEIVRKLNIFPDWSRGTAGRTNFETADRSNSTWICLCVTGNYACGCIPATIVGTVSPFPAAAGRSGAARRGAHRSAVSASKYVDI